ncbi:dipeptidase, partial [Streptomyces hyaluromycini]
MTDIITLSDSRVAEVTEQECGEPLVDLRETPGLRIDLRQADADGSYAHLRLGALRRLLQAQSLLPAGIRFLVVEGFRPPDLQPCWETPRSASLAGTRKGPRKGRIRTRVKPPRR